MRAFTETERVAIGELFAMAGVCAESREPSLAAFSPFILARINQIVTGAVRPLVPIQQQVEIMASAALDCQESLELLGILDEEKRH